MKEVVSSCAGCKRAPLQFEHEDQRRSLYSIPASIPRKLHGMVVVGDSPGSGTIMVFQLVFLGLPWLAITHASIDYALRHCRDASPKVIGRVVPESMTSLLTFFSQPEPRESSRELPRDSKGERLGSNWGPQTPPCRVE